MSESYVDPPAGSTLGGAGGPGRRSGRQSERQPRHGPGRRLRCWLLAVLLLGCGAPVASRPGPDEPAATTRALLVQAEAAEAQRRYDRAQALYLQARREAPDHASRAAAALAHGRALIFWGEYALAEAALAEAARLQPGQARAWHDLGMVRHHQGDLAGAEAALRRSIAVQPDDGRSRIALAALLWQQGRLREALRAYEAMGALDLPPRVRERVAWAIATLRQRLAADPGPTP